MVLYLGRRVCGMKLAELAAAVGLRNYAPVATCVKRYEQWLQTNATEQDLDETHCQIVEL